MPATLVALVIAACVLDPAADAHTRRAWFVVALVFCLAGDVLLMVPRDLFVGGLAAFLLGHLCYVAGFWTHGPALAAFAVSGVAVAAVVLPLARRILGALARQREVRAPGGGSLGGGGGGGAVRVVGLDDRLGPVRAPVPLGPGRHHGDVPPGPGRARGVAPALISAAARGGRPPPRGAFCPG